MGDGHGKRHGKHTQPKKWQIKLEGHWQDYDEQEDRILKRAWLVGQKNVRFQLRGQRYEYNFEKMRQDRKWQCHCQQRERLSRPCRRSKKNTTSKRRRQAGALARRWPRAVQHSWESVPLVLGV